MYVRDGYSGFVISDYASLIGPLAQKIAQGIVDLWSKEVPDSVSADPARAAQVKLIAASLQTLEKRFAGYLKPYLPNTQWYNPFTWLSSLGTSLSLAVEGGTAKSVYTQLKAFEAELSTLGQSWSTATGLAKPISTNIVDIAPDPTVFEKATDTLWTVLKIGVIGLSAWYGSRLLYERFGRKG